MRYQVQIPFAIETSKGEVKLEAKQIIKLSHDKARGLSEEGKIIPITKLMDSLFHDHMMKLKRHDLTPDEITASMPELYTQIQASIEKMDEAWLNEDLKGFKKTMQEVESLYFQALSEYLFGF